MALAVRADRAALVVPALEREAAEAALERAGEVEVRPWGDGDDPYTLLGAALGAGATMAVEKDHLTLARAEQIQLRLPETRFLDAGAEVRRLRATKTGPELELMERAARLTDEVMERTLAGLAPGQTELSISIRATSAIGDLGAAPSFDALVQSGPHSAQPHLAPTGRPLAAGDLVLLDLGAAWEGYAGDLTRMAVLGEPDARQVELHALVLAAHDAAVAAVRTGATAGAVDAAAREVIAAAGLGDFFIHRVGHGLGLQAHEGPSLDPGSAIVLETGMVITIEPGVYLPGWGGVRIEDEVVVEERGGRPLTAADHALRAVPTG